jgi:hypothetical protein
MTTYRVRFRFRVRKKLNIKDREHRFRVGDRDVVISATPEGLAIGDSEWLVMNVRGFGSLDEAQDFAGRLKLAAEVSSASTRLGVDAGRDRATLSLSTVVKESIREKTGSFVRDNIHGVDVFEDDPNVWFPAMQATGTVRNNAEPFLSDLTSLLGLPSEISRQTLDIVLLLNTTLMVAHPVAQIVFAFSAVEMLGQQHDWTSDQRQLIESLAQAAESADIGTDLERREVADAIKRGTHRVSLRQGVMRLLKSLDLEHLRARWDDLYGQRSSLVHGLAPTPGADYGQLAGDAVSLCGFILLKAIAREIPLADRHAALLYPAERSLPSGRYFHFYESGRVTVTPDPLAKDAGHDGKPS